MTWEILCIIFADVLGLYQDLLRRKVLLCGCGEHGFVMVNSTGMPKPRSRKEEDVFHVLNVHRLGSWITLLHF